ncbi:hypothetical protein [Aeromonas sobria]|uniref:hypothetical protein n=1 Tax=Aeromonas sobria TaxID=646 RepID=UPI001E49A9E7|nr:hypothetical protein [Aeromonas sobria]
MNGHQVKKLNIYEKSTICGGLMWFGGRGSGDMKKPLTMVKGFLLSGFIRSGEPVRA